MCKISVTRDSVTKIRHDYFSYFCNMQNHGILADLQKIFHILVISSWTTFGIQDSTFLTLNFFLTYYRCLHEADHQKTCPSLSLIILQSYHFPGRVIEPKATLSITKDRKSLALPSKILDPVDICMVIVLYSETSVNSICSF